jgi:hypothetical protein
MTAFQVFSRIQAAYHKMVVVGTYFVEDFKDTVFLQGSRRGDLD